MRERSPQYTHDGASGPDLPAEVFRAAEVMLHILEAQSASAQNLGGAPGGSLNLVAPIDEEISEEHTIGASLIIQFWLAKSLAHERQSDLRSVIREARRYLSKLANAR